MIDNHDESPTPDRMELATLMRRYHKRLRHRFLGAVQQHDLTPPMFAALEALDDPSPMRDVADHLSCDASYVTGLADRLEALSLIERTVDPTDRRVKQLVLTDRGRKVRSAVHSALQDSKDLFPELSDQDIHTMISLYRKLIGNEHDRRPW